VRNWCCTYVLRKTNEDTCNWSRTASWLISAAKGEGSCTNPDWTAAPDMDIYICPAVENCSTVVNYT
jgi:hypothetical protein